ncbi:hypothetical protein AG1IA_09529 [Rhizoctonia solani AG-1 IA]|uniref:Secreted protein n=1 Tax=Thanatephorus cucumeris (strain AG1-IA) TaxID=983506 RepID=L8WI13_THACA|nr:hypothetical protein AG1IA_09529 [Rhizoctonia solani AG-1 IA]
MLFFLFWFCSSFGFPRSYPLSPRPFPVTIFSSGLRYFVPSRLTPCPHLHMAPGCLILSWHFAYLPCPFDGSHLYHLPTLSPFIPLLISMHSRLLNSCFVTLYITEDVLITKLFEHDFAYTMLHGAKRLQLKGSVEPLCILSPHMFLVLRINLGAGGDVAGG